MIKEASMAKIDRILSEPRSKEYKDLRDRAAYMFITGNHPSHLRTFFTQALSLISKAHNQPQSLDGLSGVFRINGDVVKTLELRRQPMVVKVRQFMRQGWHIKPSLGSNKRMPYTKVYMIKGSEHATIQIDGSTFDHWHEVEEGVAKCCQNGPH